MPAARGSSSSASTTRCATSARASSIGLVLSIFDGTRATGSSVCGAAVLGLELLDEQALVQPAVGGEAVDRLEDRRAWRVERALAWPGRVVTPGGGGST